MEDDAVELARMERREEHAALVRLAMEDMSRMAANKAAQDALVLKMLTIRNPHPQKHHSKKHKTKRTK